jgi:hypothetical protein
MNTSRPSIRHRPTHTPSTDELGSFAGAAGVGTRRRAKTNPE